MFVYFYSLIRPLQDTSAVGGSRVVRHDGDGGVGDLSGMSLPFSSLWVYTSLTSWSLLLSFMSCSSLSQSFTGMARCPARPRSRDEVSIAYVQPEDGAVVAAGNAWITLYRDE